VHGFVSCNIHSILFNKHYFLILSLFLLDSFIFFLCVCGQFSPTIWIKVDLVWCSPVTLLSISMNGRGFCTCKCSDAKISEIREAEVLRVRVECTLLLNCRKTTGKSGWAVNSHHSDVGRYNPQGDLVRWHRPCFVGVSLYWVVLGRLRKRASSCNGQQTQSKTIII
jgi:hypothetical protein